MVRRAIVISFVLALSACASRTEPAPEVPPEVKASQPFIYDSKNTPWDASGCVMQAIAERYGATSAALREGPASDQFRVFFFRRGLVAAEVDFVEAQFGSTFVIWVAGEDGTRERLAQKMVKNC